jgi:hypothetical protein
LHDIERASFRRCWAFARMADWPVRRYCAAAGEVVAVVEALALKPAAEPRIAFSIVVAFKSDMRAMLRWSGAAAAGAQPREPRHRVKRD